MNNKIRTTNFLVHKDKFDYSKLKQDYILIRYTIPTDFKNYAKYIDKKNAYGKLENYYKELLDRPCYKFHHDEKGSVIYVLHNKNDVIKPLEFKLLSPDITFSLEPDIVEFDSDYLKGKSHILIKILLADFFYKEIKTHRICQHYFYIVGRYDKDKRGERTGFAKGVEISLKEINQGNYSEYSIAPKTVKFNLQQKPIKPHYINLYPYFEVVTTKGNEYYRQLKPSDVINFQKNGKKELWGKMKTSRYNLDILDWHTDNKDLQKTTRGYAVYQFQNRFIDFIKDKLGKEAAEPKYIEAERYMPKKINHNRGLSSVGLPLHILKTIYVYDNRMRENGKHLNEPIDIQDYVDLFNKELRVETTKDGKKEKKWNLGINFKVINSVSEFSLDKAVLVLQDIKGSEVQEEERNKNGEITKAQGLLSKLNFDDPKDELYNLYSGKIAMQTMNVNPNKWKRGKKILYNEDNYKSYFDYKLINFYKTINYRTGKKAGTSEEKETNILHKSKVCLSELLLKYYIVNNLSINVVEMGKCYPLPGLLSRPNLKNYAFQYQDIFLNIGNEGKMIFTDLTTKVGKKYRKEILKTMNIDWDNELINFYKNNYLQDAEDAKQQKRLSNSRIIFGKNIFSEIQDLEERILFQFDKGDKRNLQTKTGFEKIWINKDINYYIVGFKSMGITSNKAILCRKIKHYMNDDDKLFDDMIATFSVEFVRNKQYTVYPYFFDLINLYKEIHAY